MDLFAEVIAVTAALDAAAIDYALCGGIALAIHGAPRATKDIDVLVLPADLSRLRDVVKSCGFTVAALPMTFEATHHHSTIHQDRARRRHARARRRARRSPARGRVRVGFEHASNSGTVSVVSRAGLITLKLAAGRPQDMVDVKRLEEVARGEDDT